jgi:Xaa-Pro dipeptidase
MLNNSKKQAPLAELKSRLERFRAAMDATSPDWEIAAVFSKINLYYFTGTMQEGVLFIPRQDEAVFWVRRSYERAVDESLFPRLQPMTSFRDAAASFKSVPATVFLETEVVPLALYQRLQKYFPFKQVRSADAQIRAVRAVKSPFELGLMERAGEINRRVLEERVPQMLRAGMSEADLGAELFPVLMAEGHDGVVRFSMFDIEVVLGLIAFGESSLYPTRFDGPGGQYGLSPAAPALGSRERKLKKGDLVFLDLGCTVEGYQTDKTVTYVFEGTLPEEAVRAHRQCVELQNEVASMLKPGAIPSQIYQAVLGKLDPEFLNNFMGYGRRRAKFLGHGIGLEVDEPPVIAEGFDEPLRENMVMAVEPKKGIKEVGMVGTENTFVVSPQGGRCITGNHPGLIPVAEGGPKRTRA